MGHVIQHLLHKGEEKQHVQQSTKRTRCYDRRSCIAKHWQQPVVVCSGHIFVGCRGRRIRDVIRRSSQGLNVFGLSGCVYYNRLHK